MKVRLNQAELKDALTYWANRKFLNTADGNIKVTAVRKDHVEGSLSLGVELDIEKLDAGEQFDEDTKDMAV